MFAMKEKLSINDLLFLDAELAIKWNDDDQFEMISSWFVDANSDSTNGLYTSNASGGAKISNDDDVPTGVHYQMNFLLTDAGATTRSPMYFQGWWGNYRNVWGVAWKDGEPEIKISFKREFTKGMQDTPKK